MADSSVGQAAKLRCELSDLAEEASGPSLDEAIPVGNRPATVDELHGLDADPDLGL